MLSNQLIMGLCFGVFIGLVIGNKNFRSMVLRAMDSLAGKKSANKGNNRGRGKGNTETSYVVCPRCNKKIKIDND